VRKALIAALLAAVCTPAYAAGFVVNCPVRGEPQTTLSLSDSTWGLADTGSQEVDLTYISGTYGEGGAVFAGTAKGVTFTYVIQPVDRGTVYVPRSVGRIVNGKTVLTTDVLKCSEG
jgi:hypothetical protein